MTVPDVGTIRVLIADDSAVDVELALHELQRSGIDAHSDIVETAEEFSQRLKEHTYDVVLSDYRMPGWTGLDALRLIKEAGQDTPLILITGTLGDENAVDCVKLGVADYVLKQNLSRLGMVVRRAIADTKARRERQLVDERFSELAENISDVFFVVDGRIEKTLYVNSAFDHMWKMPRAQLYDDPHAFLERIPLEDQQHVMDSLARTISGEDTGGFEYRIVWPDGEIRWVLAHAVPIRDEYGVVCRISGIVRDITERKRAEQLLRESEERYRTLTDASFDGIAVSVDGIIVDANRGFAKMFGYALDEMIGRKGTEFVVEASIPEVQRLAANIVEGTFELVAVRKDGKEITLEATSRNYQVNGRPGRVTALRDVTEKRLLEAQFRQAQKMEAVGRLAGGVAHDFNNLLTVIMSCASMTLEDLPADDPKRDDVRAILDAADGAAALTRQLLAFSRQQAIEPRLVVLESIVANTEKMLTRLIGEDIELTTKLSANESSTLIDPGQLEQVIMNLAVNARDAMPHGGALVLETDVIYADENATAAHWPAMPGRFARLTVRDTGIGMSADTKAHIFEPFFTTKEIGKGTGLGLSMVYGIVKQCGGFIEIESEPSHGTAFRVYLPVAVAEDHPAEAPVDALVPMGGTGTVLLAEDSPTVRAAIKDILERSGYTVIAPATSLDALQISKAAEPYIDLLLTDLVMPGISGRLLADEFTRGRPHSAVLFMSGYTDDVMLQQEIRAQRLPLLQKPFTPATLVTRIRGALARSM